jgi:hypothetical protein
MLLSHSDRQESARCNFDCAWIGVENIIVTRANAPIAVIVRSIFNLPVGLLAGICAITERLASAKFPNHFMKILAIRRPRWPFQPSHRPSVTLGGP